MRVLLNTLSLSGFAAAHQHLYVTNERRPTAGHNPVLHVGTIDDPFSSIFDARDALRRQQRSNDKQIASTRYVHLRGGTHFLREPFVLDAVLDSGTAESPIVYTSYPGERATLSGGTALPASAFVNTTINHGLQVRSINLFEHGVNASVIGKGFSNPYPAPSLELFVGGRAMTPARHPNIGSATDPLLWNWIGYENLTGPADAAGTRSFSFTDSANAEWFAQSLDEGPLWLHGYWKYDWRDTFVDVESIESAGPGLPYVVEVSNSTPPQYPFTKGARFYAVGNLALLDAPNEYHVNATTGTLYFYPPADGSFDGGAEVVVSTLANALLVPAGTTDVSFTDLTIEVSQDGAVLASDVSRVQFHNCTVRNAGGPCLSLSGSDSSVTASTVAECGKSGISTSGANFDTLQPQNLSIVGNYVANTSRIVRTYQPGIGFSTVGCYYANNTIYNSPHTAMQGGCNDGLFEHNTIIKASYECTDTGAFYVGRSWSQRGNVARYNYFVDVKATEKLAQKSCSQNAFYLDDQMSGWEFYGNTIVNSTTGVLLGGGRRNVIRGNVFRGNQLDIAFDNRGMSWQTSYCEENCTAPCFHVELEALNYTEPPYSSKYPELLTIYSDSPCVPVHNVVADNMYCHKNSPAGGKFINQDDKTIDGWKSTITNNTNVC